ncbi:IclR family transcriptional regulator [Cereibacter azotoformans]|uniref:IclR family transcriptional regulator n=1 Tax=Cereibacter azotoformans TaxID=43057 RepID=A0A2T5K354_9RHOB|nr:HTH-type transcriptional regulator BhcR [Cereibacter azotoformans]AXQ95148.1 IclR family transcriptional regulator [Cereibacter sphaeroides]MBO4170560.1 IclR family transcriptional regulator [Cereibacter azotoformans]PTR16830.1 IclR family transcriptional regulator [Cereibacter azotoformans]UIJ32072.1 IclR family transcriptional regulator [Cereibacter azotoformans]
MVQTSPATTRRARGRPKAAEDKTEQNTVQSLDRALAMLRLLSQSEGMTLSELAAESGEAAATVYRALVTLQAHQMIEMEEQGQIWHIGGGAFRIGSAFLRRAKFVERARLPMERLMRATGETAALGIEADGRVMHLSQVETRQAIRAFFPEGSSGPMHATAVGKALLAWYPEERVQAILEREGLGKFTSLTITSASTLMRDLSRTRDRGYAVDDQESAEGIRAVAAPVFNSLGEPVAAISLAGPAFRVSLSDSNRFGALVKDAADEVTEATGGVPG